MTGVEAGWRKKHAPGNDKVRGLEQVLDLGTNDPPLQIVTFAAGDLCYGCFLWLLGFCVVSNC